MQAQTGTLRFLQQYSLAASKGSLKDDLDFTNERLQLGDISGEPHPGIRFPAAPHDLTGAGRADPLGGRADSVQRNMLAPMGRNGYAAMTKRRNLLGRSSSRS